MIKIETTLHGWADSIDGERVKFPLHLAFNNAGFGACWDLKVTTIVGDVRKAFSMTVEAKTSVMYSCDEGVLPRLTYEVLRFNFSGDCYTMEEVYNKALHELKRLKSIANEMP